MVIISPINVKNILYDTYKFKQEIHTLMELIIGTFCIYEKKFAMEISEHNFSTGNKYSKTLHFYNNLRISLFIIEVTYAHHRNQGK